MEGISRRALAPGVDAALLATTAAWAVFGAARRWFQTRDRESMIRRFVNGLISSSRTRRAQFLPLTCLLLKQTPLCTVMDNIINSADDIDHPPEGAGQSEAAGAKGFTNKFKAYQTDKSGTFSLSLGSFFGWRLRIHASFALQLVITWFIYFHQIAGFAGVSRSTSLVPK